MLDSTHEQEILVARWQMRQAQLRDLLEAAGATDGERVIDWEAGQIEWVVAEQKVAHGEMKALCSYSFEEQSLLMAWVNAGLDNSAVVKAVADVPSYVSECAEADAWLWAMKVAEKSGAEYLYRIASPSYLVFLGLWSVRRTIVIQTPEPAPLAVAHYIPRLPALIEEKEVVPDSPQAFILGLLENLQFNVEEKRREPAWLSQLFTNNGESVLQNASYLETHYSDADLIRRTGNTLIRIGESVGKRRFFIFPPAKLSEDKVAAISEELDRLRFGWVQAAKQQKWLADGGSREQ